MTTVNRQANLYHRIEEAGSDRYLKRVFKGWLPPPLEQFLVPRNSFPRQGRRQSVKALQMILVSAAEPQLPGLPPTIQVCFERRLAVPKYDIAASITSRLVYRLGAAAALQESVGDYQIDQDSLALPQRPLPPEDYAVVRDTPSITAQHIGSFCRTQEARSSYNDRVIEIQLAAAAEANKQVTPAEMAAIAITLGI